jgi:hypothetical protein
MTSELRVTTLSNATGDGPASLTSQGAYRAYIAMNTYSDVVGESLNNSSSTDNGTGNRTFNFTNNFAAATYYTSTSNNYTASGISRNFSSGPTAHATGSCGWQKEDSNGSATDGDVNAHGSGIGNVGELA